MPTFNPVRYNSGTTLNYSLRKNQISFGVADVEYAPTVQTKWYAYSPIIGYIIVSDSYSQGVTNQENAYPIFWGTSAKTDSLLIDLINGLPDRFGQTQFTTLEDAVGWLESEGKYGIQNIYCSTLVSDGLTLYLDAGYTLSYPLVGTKWDDLSGNDNHGLLNNITYSSDASGSLSFSSSSNSYVSFSAVTDIPSGNDEYSITTWIKPSSLGDKVIVSWGNYSNTNEANILKLTSSGIVNSWQGNDLVATVAVSTGTWHNIVATFDGTDRKIYLDGILVGSDQPGSSHNVTTIVNLTVGVGNISSAEYFDGLISNVYIYDFALDIEEIFVNLVAQSSRFSIIPPTPTPTPSTTPLPSVTPTVTPTITPTITETPTLTPTPTITETPTVTPTPTITETPTPTITPTPTTIPIFNSGDTMFIDSTDNSVYRYNPDTNLINYLFSVSTSGTSLNLGLTDNKIFVNDTIGNIYSYDYSKLPFSVTFDTTYSFPSLVGSGMTAVDDNTLLIANESVYRVNLSAATSELVFSLSGTCADCIVNGDILYNQIIDQYALTYINTGTSVSYATVFDASGNTITEINLSGFTGSSFTDLNNIRGMFTLSGDVYGMTYDLFIYNLGFGVIYVSTEGEPSNKISQKVSGASGIADNTSWENPPPYFIY